MEGLPSEAQPRSIDRPTWTAEGLGTLAARFMHEVAEAPVARVPDVLRTLLRSFGPQLGLDRTVIYMLTRDRRRFQPVAVWQAAGVPDLPVGELRATTSLLVQRVIRGEIVRIERLEAALPKLSAFDAEALRRMGHKSSVMLPLRVGGGTVGAHTFGSVHRYLSWPARFISDLRCVTDAVALAVERIRIDEQREQEQLEHDLVQQIAGIGHWRHNVALQTTFGSRELYRMLQLDHRRELTPDVLADRIEPEDRERFRAQVLALTLGEEVPEVELRVRYGDGEVRWLRCWGGASERQAGGPQLIHGIMHDITTHKRAEQLIEATHGRLVQAQEDERARLGRELHDEMGQRIAALDLRLASMSTDVGEKAPTVAVSLHEAIEQIQELAYIARGVSHALYPAELQRLGLARSVQSLCQRCTVNETIDVDLELGHVPEGLPEATSLGLYRVLQESLGNALRHSNARRISVFLGVEAEHLRLIVADDGHGFAPDAPSLGKGLGLSSMEERMRLVHGSFSVLSSPGTGTRVSANVSMLQTQEPP